MRRPRPLALALAVAVAGASVGCGIDEDVVAREAAEARPAVPEPTDETDAGTEPEEPEPEPTSSAFSVGEVPDGYEPQVAGPGEQEPDETVRPVTVLGPTPTRPARGWCWSRRCRRPTTTPASRRGPPAAGAR